MSEPSVFIHDIDPGLMQVNYGEQEDEEVIHIL
jgi:hypothetical protein